MVHFILTAMVFVGIFALFLAYLDGHFSFEDEIVLAGKFKETVVKNKVFIEKITHQYTIKRKFHSGRIKIFTKELIFYSPIKENTVSSIK